MATIESNFESICIDPNDDLVLYKKEIVRSRIEKFLYAICSLDNDDLPTPLSRIEEMYKCLVMGVDFITFTPLSRAEKFVMAMLGAYDVELLPTPISRSETLMKKIATGDNNLDDIDNLQSRYEFLLAYIIKAGGFNGGSGDFYYVTYPINSSVITLYNTVEYPVKSAILKGNTLVNLGGTYNRTDTPTWFTVFATQQEVEQSNVYYAIINNTGDGLMRLRYKTSDAVIKTVNPMSCEKFIFTATESDYLRIKNSDTISNCDGTFLLLNYQEGMENWDIPYFDGIQSVKMPVLTTTGKNLYSYGDLTINNPITYIWYYTNGKISSFGSSCKRTDGGNWFYLEKGVYSYKSINENIQNNIILVGEGETLYDSRKEVPSGWYVFRFKTKPESVDYAKISQIQLEKGPNITTYEPYKSTIVSCNEEVELRGIGDVKDELNLTTGELTQRIGEFVLDGSSDELWDIITNASGLKRFVSRVKKTHSNYSEITNWLPTANKTYWSINENGFYIGSNGEPVIVFNTNDSRYNMSITEFKNYLSQNPLIVQYQLEIESVKTVDLSVVNQAGNGILITENGEYIITENGDYIKVGTKYKEKETVLSTFDDITHVTASSEGLIPTGEITVATKDATDVIDASVMSLRMDDILNSQGTLEGSANAQSDDIDIAMLGTTDIYEQLL